MPTIPIGYASHTMWLAFQSGLGWGACLPSPPEAFLQNPPLSGCEPFSLFWGPPFLRRSFPYLDALPRVLKKELKVPLSSIVERLKLLKGTWCNRRRWLAILIDSLTPFRDLAPFTVMWQALQPIKLSLRAVVPLPLPPGHRDSLTLDPDTLERYAHPRFMRKGDTLASREVCNAGRLAYGCVYQAT